MSGARVSALYNLSVQLNCVAGQTSPDLELLDYLLQNPLFDWCELANLIGAEPGRNAEDKTLLMERGLVHRLLIATFNMVKQNVALILAAHGMQFEIYGRSVTPKVSETPVQDLTLRAKKCISVAVALLNQFRLCWAQIQQVDDGLVVMEVCRRIVLDLLKHVPGCVEVNVELREKLLPVIPEAALLRILDEKAMEEIMSKSLAEIVLTKPKKPEGILYSEETEGGVEPSQKGVPHTENSKVDKKIPRDTVKVSEESAWDSVDWDLTPNPDKSAWPENCAPQSPPHTYSSSAQRPEQPSQLRGNEESQRRIFVANVPYDCGYPELRWLFIQFGEIESVQIRANRYYRSRNNIAFVKYFLATSAACLFNYASHGPRGGSFVQLRPGLMLRVEYQRARRIRSPAVSVECGESVAHSDENKDTIAEVQKGQEISDPMKERRAEADVLEVADHGQDVSDNLGVEHLTGKSLQEKQIKKVEDAQRNQSGLDPKESQDKTAGAPEICDEKFDQQHQGESAAGLGFEERAEEVLKLLQDSVDDEVIDKGQVQEELCEKIHLKDLPYGAKAPQKKPNEINELASNLANDRTLVNLVSDKDKVRQKEVLHAIKFQKDQSINEAEVQMRIKNSDNLACDLLHQLFHADKGDANERFIEEIDPKKVLCSKSATVANDGIYADLSGKPNDSSAFATDVGKKYSVQESSKTCPNHQTYDAAELGVKPNDSSTLASEPGKGPFSGVTYSQRGCISTSSNTSTSSSGGGRYVGGHSNHSVGRKKKNCKKRVQQRRRRGPILLGTTFDSSIPSSIGIEAGEKVPKA